MIKIDWQLVSDIVCFICYGILAIIVIGIILAGCTPKPIPIAYDCPIIELPNSPISQTKNLTANSKPNTVVQSYAADLSAYRAWNQAVYQEIIDVNRAEKIK